MTYTANFDLGGGLNFLNVDETAGLFTTFDLYLTQLVYANFFAVADTIINFANISGGVSINASDDSNSVYIYGVPTTFSGYQHTIGANGGDDQFFLYSHDDLGNFSINGAVGLSGGSGTDTVTFDDTLSDNGFDYTFDNPFGFQTTDVFVGNGGVGVGSDVESLDMEGSSGVDGYEFSSYLSATTALTIHAGEGNDFIDITPQSMVVSENISASVPFSFDGGSGINSFSLNNSLSGGRWFYTQFGNQINTTLVGSPVVYSLTMGVANFANVSVFGGYRDEAFFVEDVPSGQTVVLNGGGGYDAFYVADDSGNPKVIAGHIVIDGGTDGGELHVYDSADAAARSFMLKTGPTAPSAAWRAIRSSDPAVRCSFAICRIMEALLECR